MSDDQTPRDAGITDDDAQDGATLETTLDENALRDTAEWIAAIGPDDDSRSERAIREGLEDYGIDLMGEDDFVSDPTLPSDQPDWAEDNQDDLMNDPLPGTVRDPNAIQRRIQQGTASSATFRPTEDAATDALRDPAIADAYEGQVYQESRTFKDEGEDFDDDYDGVRSTGAAPDDDYDDVQDNRRP